MPTALRYITNLTQSRLFRWGLQVTIERDGSVSAVHEGVSRTRNRAKGAIRELMRQHSHEDFRLNS